MSILFDQIMNSPAEGGYYSLIALAKKKLNYAHPSTDARAAQYLREAGYKIAVGFAPVEGGFRLYYNVYKLEGYNMDIHDKCAEMYLSYFNEFLTLDGFASFYGLPDALAREILKHGKFVHENRVKGKKQCDK